MDIVYFLFIKFAAALGIFAVFAVPLAIAYLFIFVPIDADEGFRIFRPFDKHTKAERLKRYIALGVWYSTVGMFLGLAALAAIGKMWPFGYPHNTNSSGIPLPAIFYHNLTDNFGEFQKRFKTLPPLTRTEHGTELRQFVLVDWAPPKHFYVTLKDAKSGDLHERLYVSKHCSTGDLRRGDTYNITVRYFSMSNAPAQRMMEFTSLSSVFC